MAKKKAPAVVLTVAEAVKLADLKSEAKGLAKSHKELLKLVEKLAAYGGVPDNLKDLEKYVVTLTSIDALVAYFATDAQDFVNEVENAVNNPEAYTS